MLNLLTRRADTRLKFPLVEHSRQDVAQVSAQSFQLFFAVFGVFGVDQSILLELIHEFLRLLQAAVEQEEAFI